MTKMTNQNKKIYPIKENREYINEWQPMIHHKILPDKIIFYLYGMP